MFPTVQRQTGKSLLLVQAVATARDISSVPKFSLAYMGKPSMHGSRTARAPNKTCSRVEWGGGAAAHTLPSLTLNAWGTQGTGNDTSRPVPLSLSGGQEMRAAGVGAKHFPPARQMQLSNSALSKVQVALQKMARRNTQLF